MNLEPGIVMDAAALAIPHHPVPAEQVVAGNPATGVSVRSGTQRPLTVEPF